MKDVYACIIDSNYLIFNFKVNLRVANLKGADAQNCDLRRSCLAGADLEVHYLTNSLLWIV